jgi:outer membrane protein OmpA-like peptidoglycan-associated protein
MGERMLQVSPEEMAVARKERETRPDSPAIRLLDALNAGDIAGVLAQCGPTTTVNAENMRWSCTGPDEIERWIAEARGLFPDLSFESMVRHVGFGLVIEEARVRDGQPGAEAVAPDRDGPSHRSATPDQPTGDLASRAVAVWRDHSADDDGPPPPLNMPVRVTVKHDDLQVHEIALGFPAALLKRALGRHVDPLEMSLSEVQSAFIAPVGAEFTTHAIARPELTLIAPPPLQAPVANPPEPALERPERRRRRGLVPLVLLLLVALAGAGWYVLRGNLQSADVATPPPVRTSHSPSSSPKPTPTASQSKPPVVTQPPSSTPTRKPNVTLKSDLAFGFNSSTLSTAAKGAIAKVARQVFRAGLTGKIYIDGYTDSLGSAAYGKVLSQRRADAVANYLSSRLVGAPVTIVPIGHGEANPIASNATAAGRQKNRRVTITLPKP